MKTRPNSKPNSSYASYRLTRNNFLGPSLLSQVAGVKTRSRDGKPEPPKPKPEPATDDEPLSLSDDSSDSATGDEEKGDHDEGGRAVEASKAAAKEESAPRSSKRTSPPKRNSSASRERNDNDDDEDDPFNMMSLSSQNHKRRRNTYGSSAARNIHAAPAPTRPSSSRQHKKTDSTLSPGSPKFQLPREVSIPDRSPPQPEKSREALAKGFQVPQEVNVPSPNKERSTAPAFRMPTGGDLDDSVHSSQVGNGFKEPPGLPSSSLTTKDSGSVEVSSPSSLSSVPSDLLPDNFEIDELDMSSSEREEALCPVCHAEVEWSMLEMFRSQRRQGPREKRAFCRQHKKRDAEKEWERRGYPTIDWDGFEERIRRHLPAIENLVIKGGPSYYRDILDAKIRDGKVNWRLTVTGDELDNMACGYYGSKGATKM